MIDDIDIISQKDRTVHFLRIQNLKSDSTFYFLSMIDKLGSSIIKIDDNIKRLKRKTRGYTHIKKIK